MPANEPSRSIQPSLRPPIQGTVTWGLLVEQQDGIMHFLNISTRSQLQMDIEAVSVITSRGLRDENGGNTIC